MYENLDEEQDNILGQVPPKRFDACVTPFFPNTAKKTHVCINVQHILTASINKCASWPQASYWRSTIRYSSDYNSSTSNCNRSERSWGLFYTTRKYIHTHTPYSYLLSSNRYAEKTHIYTLYVELQNLSRENGNANNSDLPFLPSNGYMYCRVQGNTTVVHSAYSKKNINTYAYICLIIITIKRIALKLQKWSFDSLSLLFFTLPPFSKQQYVIILTSIWPIRVYNNNARISMKNNLPQNIKRRIEIEKY